jgi:isoprenylcysteine carboxyl methyltransferase (ICMT) family protein YpbQ
MLALIFSILNAAVLVVRIRAEARALASAGLQRERPVS